MRGRHPSILAVALGIFVFAAAALTLTHHNHGLRVPAPIAIRDVQRDDAIGPKLRRLHYDHASVAPVDGQIERVSFFAGPRIVAEAAVTPNGTAEQFLDFTRLVVPYGNWLAYEPAILIGLGAMFVLVAGVLPLRRLRNLDAAAILSLVAPMLLLQHRYVAASVLSAVPGLVYLLVRLAWLALGPERQPVPSRPVIDGLTARLGSRGRARVLRILLAALVFLFVLVATTSPNAVDVVYAVMEGATKLVHGVLPYGHLPGDVVHGDTYPLLSYGLYAPLALAEPVRSSWDDVDLVLAATGIVAVAVAAALFLANVGGRGRPARPPDDEATGLRAALVWLSFPPLLVIVSTGTTDVTLAAILLFAVLLWRRPGLSMGLLAVAGWFKLAPFALVPMWLAPLRGRRLLGALVALSAVSLSLLIVLVALGGSGGPASMIRAVSYQFTRGSEQSLASSLGAPWLAPVAQAATLSLLAAFTLHFWRRPAAADRECMAAAAGALIIALQLAANYWAFLYLVWVAPLLALTLFEQRALAPASVAVRQHRAWRTVNPVPAGE